MRSILCALFGHQLGVIQEFSRTERKVACRRCRKHFAMSDREKAFLPWDSDFESFYRERLGIEYTNRLKRV